MRIVWWLNNLAYIVYSDDELGIPPDYCDG